MNANSPQLHPAKGSFSRAEALLHASSGLLRDYADELGPLNAALRELMDLGDVKTKKSAARLALQLGRVEPSVTMIGQIKSGKTRLVNALIGQPDLLPADVNPWTSVVTSLHLSPHKVTPDSSAKFRFFDMDEWDRLVSGGGRIGELANRAGADDEISKIKAQVEMMREKSKARLGRKFEALLGTEHCYGYFDRELIERYVCLGDDFEDDSQTSQSRGRFADITKSADLRMQQRGFPINLCVRDTPGVNDTFMIREQITIKSIRDSRICVVVLSAHQALSTTDLALIRLISNVKSREVVIFVNRIDELATPKTQVPEIAKSVLETLKAHNGPTDAKVIFGSALWAQSAMAGSLAIIPPASREALFDWAETAEIADVPSVDPHRLMWEMSGLPALMAAISERIIDGEWRDIVRKTSIAAGNLIKSVKVADNLNAKASVVGTTVQMRREDILTDLDAIQSKYLMQLSTNLDELAAPFQHRVDQAHSSFLSRATEALEKHLEIYGEECAWKYDPAGLRVLLASAYKVHGARCQTAFKKASTEALAELATLFSSALNLPKDLFDPNIPDVPRIAPPVTLGQTIALDLQGSWWKSWWTRRQSYEAQAKNFYDLIKAETDSLTTDLTCDQAVVLRQDIVDVFGAFLSDQIAVLASLTEDRTVSNHAVGLVLGVGVLEERDQILSCALQSLERYVA